MNVDQLVYYCGVVVVAAPTTLLLALGGPMIFGRSLGERLQSLCTKTSVLVGLAASLLILMDMLLGGSRRVVIELGNWVTIPEEHFHFHIEFIFYRLSVPFAILSFVLCGTVGAFASVYLQRDRGYNRFFLQYALFLLGMVISSLAGSIETLFFGWELVGLSSALLVAYFHERPGPVRNGTRIWIVYRLSSIVYRLSSIVYRLSSIVYRLSSRGRCVFGRALTMHHLAGVGGFGRLMGEAPWPGGVADVNAWEAFAVGLLLLMAAAGKSRMVPFSG